MHSYRRRARARSNACLIWCGWLMSVWCPVAERFEIWSKKRVNQIARNVQRGVAVLSRFVYSALCLLRLACRCSSSWSPKKTRFDDFFPRVFWRLFLFEFYSVFVLLLYTILETVRTAFFLSSFSATEDSTHACTNRQ